MNTNETLQQMQQLKFHGMAASYATQLDLPIHQQLESHELIGQLMQAEMLSRNNERTAYYLRLAKLRQPAIPEHIECSISRNLTKQQMLTLLEGHYLRQGENVDRVVFRCVEFRNLFRQFRNLRVVARHDGDVLLSLYGIRNGAD